MKITTHFLFLKEFQKKISNKILNFKTNFNLRKIYDKFLIYRETKKKFGIIKLFTINFWFIGKPTIKFWIKEIYVKIELQKIYDQILNYKKMYNKFFYVKLTIKFLYKIQILYKIYFFICFNLLTIYDIKIFKKIFRNKW